jgi:3-dehydroquinate synthase
MSESITIRSRNGPYHVRFHTDLSLALINANAQDQTWLLADDAVLALHRNTIAAAFPDNRRIFGIEANEDNKSYERLGPIFTWLLSTGFRRDSVLVALGGGIIQDIASFVATTIMRGARWRFIPTTLLAQCDSCIGAKSSINIGRFKNQLGSFHAPTDIFLIPGLLRTLPDEALRSGFAEIVKFHLLDGEVSWRSIQSCLTWNDPEMLPPLIRRSLHIKQRYIEEDEFDRGIRNLLNYGHTFGHAFESASGFAIPHGIGVALGMSAATFISESLAMVPAGHHREVDAVLRHLYCDSASTLQHATLSDILTAMGTDKKNVGGAAYVILTKGPGNMVKVKVDLDQQIRPLLAEFLARLA